MRKRGFAALVAAAAALVVGPGTASADQGRGAIVVDDRGCTESPFGFGTTCVDSHLVFQSTATPSGNFIGVINLDSDVSFTGAGFLAGCNNSVTVKSHDQSLSQDGETQTFHFLSKGEFSFTCFGFSLTCEFAIHNHFAEGQFQFSRSEFNCA